MAISDFLGPLVNAGGLAASAYLPYSNAGDQMDNLQSGVDQAVTRSGQLAQEAAANTQFTPFSVTSGGGTGSFNQQGGLNVGLNAQQQDIQQNMFGQAQQLSGMGFDPNQYQNFQNQAMSQAGQTLGSQAPTADQLFQNMQQAQQSENDRTRLQMEQRLFGQGRLGVETSAYGGTPDQLAMEKAFQEQQSQNYFQTQQLAPQLQQQNTQNASSLFGLGTQAAQQPYGIDALRMQNIGQSMQGGFAGENQMLASLNPSLQLQNALTNRDIAGTNAQTQLGMAGLEAGAAGMSAMGQLEGQRVNALSKSLSGLFSATEGGQSPIDSLIASLLGSGSGGSNTSSGGSTFGFGSSNPTDISGSF
jgi:uncharacterized membrane-anchored protein YhcB (DUF1043 family)